MAITLKMSLRQFLALYLVVFLATSTMVVAYNNPASAQDTPEIAVAGEITEGPVSARNAMLASSGRIVFYYGANIQDIQAAVNIVRDGGLPAIALSGLPDPDAVLLLVNQSFGGEFNQDDLNAGVLTVAAEHRFQELLTEGLSTTQEPE